MQYANNTISFGQIKLPVAGMGNIGTLPVPGVQAYASLFSDALTLKIGDGSKMGGWRKMGSYGENNTYRLQWVD